MKRQSRRLLAALAGCLCTFLLVTGKAEAAEQAGGISVEAYTAPVQVQTACTVWQEPGGEEAALGQLAVGETLNACGIAEGGWLQVVYGNGIGYARADALTPIPADQAMLAALAAQAAFVKENLPAQGMGEPIPENGQPAASQTPAGPDGLPINPSSQPLLSPGGNVILAGDSRVGQMANAVGGSAAWPGVAFVACYGGGVEWLSQPVAKKEIDAFVTPGSVIILNYGVNDLSKHTEYIDVINRYSREWIQEGAAVFFASVGPVGENEYGKRNWAVEYFKDKLFDHLNGQIGRIDLYAYLTAAGCQMEADGIHFTPDTSARIFTFLMNSIGYRRPEA